MIWFSRFIGFVLRADINIKRIYIFVKIAFTKFNTLQTHLNLKKDPEPTSSYTYTMYNLEVNIHTMHKAVGLVTKSTYQYISNQEN